MGRKPIMIRAVCWDFGGVISASPFDAFCDSYATAVCNAYVGCKLYDAASLAECIAALKADFCASVPAFSMALAASTAVEK